MFIISLFCIVSLLLREGFFLFVLPSWSVSTELPLSPEVSKNGVCDASYQLMLWRRDQPVRCDRWVTPPAACRPLRDAAPGVRERVGSLVPVHRLRAPVCLSPLPPWANAGICCPLCRWHDRYDTHPWLRIKLWISLLVQVSSVNPAAALLWKVNLRSILLVKLDLQLFCVINDSPLAAAGSRILLERWWKISSPDQTGAYLTLQPGFSMGAA